MGSVYSITTEGEEALAAAPAETVVGHGHAESVLKAIQK